VSYEQHRRGVGEDASSNILPGVHPEGNSPIFFLFCVVKIHMKTGFTLNSASKRLATLGPSGSGRVAGNVLPSVIDMFADATAGGDILYSLCGCLTCIFVVNTLLFVVEVGWNLLGVVCCAYRRTDIRHADSMRIIVDIWHLVQRAFS